MRARASAGAFVEIAGPHLAGQLAQRTYTVFQQSEGQEEGQRPGGRAGQLRVDHARERVGDLNLLARCLRQRRERREMVAAVPPVGDVPAKQRAAAVDLEVK